MAWFGRICFNCGLLSTDHPDVFGDLKDPNICPVCGNKWDDVSQNKELQNDLLRWRKKHRKEDDWYNKWIENHTGHSLDPTLVAKREEYNKKVEEYIRSGQRLKDMRDREFEKSFKEAEARLDQKAANPDPTPPSTPQITCPYCHSTRTKKITQLSRMASIGFWGVFSKKIGKQWHCEDCGSDF